MKTRTISMLAIGGLLSMNPGPVLERPHIDKLEQNTRTVEWATTVRATIGQQSSRKIRVSGPWMDFVTSATTSNGVSARSISHEWRQVTMILDAAASSARGDMTLRLNISCPPVNFECSSSITLPVKIFETGPINGISPSGVVPANTAVTFDLTGQALSVAKLNPRLLTLRNASIVSRTASTMRVKGTTPSCGYIDVALTDESGDGEFVYRKGGSLQAVLAGTICGSSLAPPGMSQHYCTPPTTWNVSANACTEP